MGNLLGLRVVEVAAMSLPEIRLHLRMDRRAEAAAALMALEVAASAAVAPYESRHAKNLSERLIAEGQP